MNYIPWILCFKNATVHKKRRKTCILYASENFTEIFDFSTQDIPKPLFMSTKEPTDWSEDEQKLAKEYEKKVKDLQEEREKYRKVSITQCFKNGCWLCGKTWASDCVLTVYQ